MSTRVLYIVGEDGPRRLSFTQRELVKLNRTLATARAILARHDAIEVPRTLDLTTTDGAVELVTAIAKRGESSDDVHCSVRFSSHDTWDFQKIRYGRVIFSSGFLNLCLKERPDPRAWEAVVPRETNEFAKALGIEASTRKEKFETVAGSSIVLEDREVKYVQFLGEVGTICAGYRHAIRPYSQILDKLKEGSIGSRELVGAGAERR